MLNDDPIVAEVRAVRKKIEAVCNDDFKLLYKQMLELQKQYSIDLITHPLPLRAMTWSLQNVKSQDALTQLSSSLRVAA